MHRVLSYAIELRAHIGHHQAWLAFAHHQHPNRSDWPAYELPTRPTLLFATQLHLEHDPQREKRQLWHHTALA